MKLIIATPSPYARKVRILLREKGIEYDEVIDNPWVRGAGAPAHNPLGKIPILVLEDGSAVHDSKVIAEYLETLDQAPQFLPAGGEDRVRVRQIEAVADGICDAVVLILMESARPPAQQSAQWIARQRGKAEAGTSELANVLGEKTWYVGEAMTLADVAAACALAYMDLRLPDHDWRSAYPRLVEFSERMEARDSFRGTVPVAQDVGTVR